MSERARGVAFAAAALALCCVLFGDALLGRSMMAPLDIAAGQWPQYRFVDPAAGGVPRNHHVVDQLGYDLPLQWTVYHAWRRGEVPWWDPFIYGGRPLLADAHVSAADPVRVLCYLALPRFELAYHWTRALHFLLGGIGMFCLLRKLGVSAGVAGGAGLLAMCAGSVVVFFGHPWIHASFVYYPWLWLAWHSLWEKPGAGARVAAVLLAAGALYAGNLQSHAYLAVFALTFCVAYGWRRGAGIVVPVGVCAALLAAPVLWPEIELFLRNIRPLAEDARTGSGFEGLMVASAAWPWSVGTFRTVAGSVLGFHPGFAAFIGVAGFVLAWIGARSGFENGARRGGIALVLCFAVIMLVPALARIFYPRCAGLAVLGGIVLAAFGAEALRASTVVWRRAAWMCAVFAVLVVLGTAAAVWMVYPRVQQRLLARMEAHALTDGSEGRSLPLRRAQVANYPREIGFTNPEVPAAWLTLPALAALFAVPRWRRFGVPALLALNLVSPLLFALRYIPRAPVEQWQRLLAGGPEQQGARARFADRGLRFVEREGAGFAAVFPQNLAHLYGVHVAHGYSALVPPNMAWSGAPRDGARFSWIGDPPRPVAVAAESLNTVTLDIADGPAGWLLRTDTHYPGWQAKTDAGAPLAVKAEGATFSRVEVPAGAARIHLRYRPAGHAAALALGVAGLAGCVVWARASTRPLRGQACSP